MSQNTKQIGIKFPGGNRATETKTLLPGTTVSEVLKSLNLTDSYQLSDAHDRDRVFRPSDVLYAMVEDGDLLHACALVDAGR